ncbi:hypothetical protein WDU94_003127 [Cyamophila willieti]
MCLMKAMHHFIASHTFDEMSVFTEHDNSNFLKTHFENRIDEMNGIIKLAQDRQVKNRNPNVVRETFDLMKRLLLAYVNDKIGHVFIINMNVAPDIPFMYRVCLSLYEPLKKNLENEKAELEKQMILDYMKSSGKIPPQIEEEESNIKEIEKESVKPIENIMRLPSKLRSECLMKMEPFNVIWEEFLKAKPGLKFTLDFYLKDLNTMENKLDHTEDMLTNENFAGHLKDHEIEDLISESKTLERQITLTRKKIIQIQFDYQPQFNEFCSENQYVALPDDIDFMDHPSKSPVTINPCSKQKCEALNDLNLESFYNYLDQMIRNSELATILGVDKTKESQNKFSTN